MFCYKVRRWSSVILILLTIRLVNCDPLDATENENRLQTCGKSIQSKVYNGRDATQSEAPWSVFFNMIDKNKKSMTVCTGSIVSSRHILIATHCFAEQEPETGDWTVDGSFDKSNCVNDDYVLTDPEIMKRISLVSNKVTIARAPEKITLVKACLKRKPDKTSNYKDVKPQMYTDDFAIIDLYEDLTFSKSASSVCIAPDESANKVGTKLDYYGFGLNPSKGKNPTTPEEDNTGVLRHETVTIFSSDMEDYYFLTHDETKKTIACTGDSGGGSIANISNRKTIIGVLSQTACSNIPKREGGTEQYASVGYYNDQICKLTGICKTPKDYENYHKGYVKKLKPARKQEDIQPQQTINQDPQNDKAAVENVDGNAPDSSMGKSFNLILASSIFALIF